jgi:hypothetical protein
MIVALAVASVFVLTLVLVPVWSRWEMPGALESLRLGRFHHAFVGFALGSLIVHESELGAQFEGIRNSLISLSLVWIGLQAGLDLDLSKYRKRPASQLISESIQSLGTILLLFGCALLGSTLLRVHFGLRLDPFLLSLLLAISAATIRTPDVIYPWKGRITQAGLNPDFPLAVNTNTASFVLLLLCFPFFYNDAVLRLGPYTSVGNSSTLAAILALGLLLGLLVDFIFRGFDEDISCTYLSTGLSLVVASLCLALKMPGLLVGFLAGTWLINTTIRRRIVLELSERISGVAEPTFYFLVGSILGTAWISEGQVIGVFVASLLLSRLFVRGMGQAAADKLQNCWRSWTPPLAVGLRPMGTVSVASVVQAYYLVPALQSSELLIACLFSVYLSQLLPVPTQGDSPMLGQQISAPDSD